MRLIRLKNKIIIECRRNDKKMIYIFVESYFGGFYELVWLYCTSLRQCVVNISQSNWRGLQSVPFPEVVENSLTKHAERINARATAEKRRKKWRTSPSPSLPSRVKSIHFFFSFHGLFPCSSEPIESKKEEWRRKKSDCPVCWTGSADSAGSASNTSGAYQPLKRKIPI